MSVGKTAIFECRTKLEVIWLFNGAKTSPKAEPVTVPESGHHVLKIEDVQFVDSGNYSCQGFTKDTILTEDAELIRYELPVFQKYGILTVIGKEKALQICSFSCVCKTIVKIMTKCICLYS